MHANPSLRFTLGIRDLRIGAVSVDSDDRARRARPVPDRVAAGSGETAQLGRIDGTQVVHLAERGSRHPLSRDR